MEQFVSIRAQYTFLFFMVGGLSFSALFGWLGLNAPGGAIIGAMLGLASGYVVGRKIELEREK